MADESAPSEVPLWAREMFSTLADTLVRTQQDSMNESLARINENIADLQARTANPTYLAATTGEPATTTRQPTPVNDTPYSDPVPSPPEKPLPRPAAFSGRRADYGPWSQQMRTKLATDGFRLGGPSAQAYLIYSCLGEAAARQCASYYTTMSDRGVINPNDFMAYLDHAFKDPNEVQLAMSKLQRLRQFDNQSFATFLPIFESTLASAGGIDWPDAVKINYLSNALKTDLRRTLVTATIPTEYAQYVSFIGVTASRLELLSPTSQRISRGSNLPPNAYRDRDGDTPMSGINRVGPADPAENPRRQNPIICYACNKPGHIKRYCRSRNQRMAHISHGEIAAGEPEDLSESHEPSENE
jgi:hypothetical protein